MKDTIHTRINSCELCIKLNHKQARMKCARKYMSSVCKESPYYSATKLNVINLGTGMTSGNNHAISLVGDKAVSPGWFGKQMTLPYLPGISPWKTKFIKVSRDTTTISIFFRLHLMRGCFLIGDFSTTMLHTTTVQNCHFPRNYY